MNKIDIHAFFNEPTNSITYVLVDQASKQAAVIDPVFDHKLNEKSLGVAHIDKVIGFLDRNNLHLEWILETYAHTGNITAAQYLKAQRGGQIGISEHITKVQHSFQKAFNLDESMACDGSQYDYLFQDGEVIFLGHVEMEVIATPGHTPACLSYKIEDALFVGNTLLMPDVGTARTDFPCSSAKALYQSIQRILSLPDSTRIFVGYDHKPTTRKNYAWETSVLQEKRDNLHFKSGFSETGFIFLREQLDKVLPSYEPFITSIKANLEAGRL